MKLILLFLSIFAVVQITFGFIDIQPGNEYIFKVEWQNNLTIRKNGTIDSEYFTTVMAKMTVKKTSDDWLVFQLSQIKKKDRGVEEPIPDLDKESKALIEKGKVVKFEDTGVRTSFGAVIKQMIVNELIKDHSDIIRLLETEEPVVYYKPRVEMSIGMCKVENTNLKIKKGMFKTITAKSHVHDCILSQETLVKFGDKTLEDITADSFTKVSLLFDTTTDRQVGVISSSEITVKWLKDVDHTSVQSVFINFIDSNEIV